MGKQRQSREERNREAIDLFDLVQERKATESKKPKLVEEGNFGFLGQDEFNTTKFDKDFIPGLDFFNAENTEESRRLITDGINETRAQNQSKGEKLLHGLGRVAAKTFTEFGKGLGYLGSSIPALVAQDLEVMTDNFWVNAFQELDDNAKESLPVYIRDEIENGSLARQIWSPEFWATEGADGLGFMLSAIGTGGTTAALSKSLQLSTKVASLLGKGKQTANLVDNFLISGTQTLVEAAAETKGIVDELKQDWQRFQQEDGSYIRDGITYSGEEVKEKIGNAGVETLALNSLLLLGPNSLQTKYLFGKGDEVKGLLGKIDNSSPETIKDALSKITPWKTGSKQALIDGFKSAGAEGFQELSQFAVENYESKKGKGLANKGLIDGLIEGYQEGLTTIEGQKSIFLGAVLGLGPGAIGAYKNTKAELSQAQGLSELLSNSSQNFKDNLTSIYKRDEEGNIITKDNKPVPDEKKLTELFDSVSQDLVYSKLYQESKLNKDIDGAKHALTEITIKNLYPYLTIEGGLNLWQQHVKETTQLLENDAVDLGFDTKEEYSNYLNSIATKAREEYKKVKNQGPSFFGINSKQLIKNKEDKRDVGEKLNNFINNIEYNAVRLSIIDSNLRDQLSQVNKDILELESKVELNDNETLEEKIKQDKITSLLHNIMKKKKKNIQSSLNSIGEKYELLFNKEEQQKAFEDLIRKEEKIEDAIIEDEIKSKEDDEFIDTFYENLNKKGYNVNKSEDGNVNDFGQNNVTLKDDNGEVYRIEKEFDKNTESTTFVIRNLNTSSKLPLTTDNLKKLNLDKESNILTKQEFQTWVKLKKVTERNNTRLEQLSKLINDHNRTKKRFNKEVRELAEDLARYREELNFWSNATGLNESDVSKEISNLNKKVADINNKIDSFEDKKKNLTQSLRTLRQFKSELEDTIDEGNKEEFSFGIRLKELEAKLVEGDFDLDITDVEDSIDILNDWLEELYSSRNILTDSLDDLEDVIDKENKELEKDGDWETLSNDDRYLLSTYKLKAKELQQVKSEIKKIQKELARLGNNKSLLIKYEKLNINLRTLEKRNKIQQIKDLENNISENQRKDFKNSPKEQTLENREDIIESSKKKTNPFSTITAVYDINQKNDDGTFKKTKNWKQAARWSKTLNRINLDNLGDYSVRFVNNAQLRELGQEPPIEDENALYTVIYDKSNELYTDSEGIIFTGIANTSTYFGDNFSSIDVLRMPEHQYNAEKLANGNGPVIFNNNEYNSLEEFKKAILSELEIEYDKWRKDLVDRLNNKEVLYSSIQDISKGIARFSTEFKKPKEVLNIKSIRVPRTDTIMKSSQGLINIENGMPYAELENGQMQRLLNYQLENLPEAEKAKFINKILKFMTLAEQMKNHNFKQEFNFKGTKSKIGLFGNAGKTGILDLFINWGRTPNKEFGIAIYPVQKGNLDSPLEIVFDFKGVKEKMNLSNLKDDNGRIRQYGDPEIKTLTDFLETKFLNVDYKSIGNKKFKNGFWMPENWEMQNGIPVITYKKHKNYEDYVLDNHLYTNIESYNEETDDIPNFINQYLTFDKNIKSKPIVKAPPKEPEVIDKPEIEDSIPLENLELTPVEELFNQQELLDNLDKNRDVATEKKEDTVCKPSKKPNFTKRKGLDNLNA